MARGSTTRGQESSLLCRFTLKGGEEQEGPEKQQNTL